MPNMNFRRYLLRLRESLRTASRKRRRAPSSRRFRLEYLEDRTAPSVTTLGVPDWLEQGPGPIINGNNVEVIPNRPQDGAINAMAIDPTNPDRMFVATVNGGIWRTNTARNSPFDGVDNDGDGTADEAT